MAEEGMPSKRLMVSQDLHYKNCHWTITADGNSRRCKT